jgi:tRNA threonylcarbamoyladenosine biosynthesis protein TsaE
MIARRESTDLLSESPVQTIEIGRQLALILQNHDLIVLTGPLGAGKTCLIKGIGLGLGIKEDDIKSPSFTLVNEYYGTFPLYHFDLYRIKESQELYQIGWDDYLLRDGIAVVEWGEKAEGLLPPRRIEIVFEIVSEKARSLKLTFIGE